MAKKAGAALKSILTLHYVLAFCCAAIVMGIFSYFLATLAKRDDPISNKWNAVTGMSGAAVIYLIFAILLTAFIGGIAFLGYLAVLLNLLFCGAFIAIAVLTRDGTRRCNSTVPTPLGTGNGLACRLNKTVFIVSIIAAVLLLLAAVAQLLLVRQHKKEKAFGPSPTNGYTSGTGKPKFWQRKPKTTPVHDTEMSAGTGSLAVPHPNVRPSHDTGYTGSTMSPAGAYESTPKHSVAHDVPHKPAVHNDGHRTGAHPAGLMPGHGAGHSVGHAQVTPNIPPAIDHGGYHVDPTPSGINHNHPYALDAPRGTVATNY